MRLHPSIPEPRSLASFSCIQDAPPKTTEGLPTSPTEHRLPEEAPGGVAHRPAVAAPRKPLQSHVDSATRARKGSGARSPGGALMHPGELRSRLATRIAVPVAIGACLFSSAPA